MKNSIKTKFENIFKNKSGSLTIWQWLITIIVTIVVFGLFIFIIWRVMGKVFNV